MENKMNIGKALTSGALAAAITYAFVDAGSIDGSIIGTVNSALLIGASTAASSLLVEPVESKLKANNWSLQNNDKLMKAGISGGLSAGALYLMSPLAGVSALVEAALISGGSEIAGAWVYDKYVKQH